MNQESNLLQEKNLNKLTNNHQKMGLKHQSSHGNIKAMAVRHNGHTQSQVFPKSKTQFYQTSQAAKKSGCEKENSQATSHVQQNNFMI